jgi:hypothetical protein
MQASAFESNSPTAVIYVESDLSVDLEPTPGAQLLFRALLFHSPGFDEEVQFFVGPSTCGGYDVLWCNSDWVDDRDMSAGRMVTQRHSNRVPTMGSPFSRILERREDSV